MEKRYSPFEFEAEIHERGTIVLPHHVARGLAVGTRVTIRVVVGSISPALRSRQVTEEEIESIARCQSEERDHVVAFLRSEGSLAGNRPFARRTAVWLGSER